MLGFTGPALKFGCSVISTVHSINAAQRAAAHSSSPKPLGGVMQGNGAVEGALGNTLGWEEEFPPQQSGVTEQSLEAHPIS